MPMESYWLKEVRSRHKRSVAIVAKPLKDFVDSQWLKAYRYDVEKLLAVIDQESINN